VAPNPKVLRLGTLEELNCRLLESRTPGGPKLISTVDQEMIRGGKRGSLVI
jgi:hypothetical protein